MSQAAPVLHGMTFHHFGLAVKEPEPAFRMLRVLGYMEGRQVFDPKQRVNLAMRHHPKMPDVEVIWPGREPSPIDGMLKRADNLIYHTCYECLDPEHTMATLEAAGVEWLTVSPATPAILFDGREVSFHVIAGFGLIELLRTSTDNLQ